MNAQVPKLPKDLAEFTFNQAVNQVLPFWLDRVISPDGGLYGAVTAQGEPVLGADQGCILYARTLWSFSTAYQQTNEAHYLSSAEQIYKVLVDNFWDHQHGGVFALLDSERQAKDSSKVVIVQSYCLYALSRFYQITQRDTIEQNGQQLVQVINEHFLRKDGTYCNDLNRDFSEPENAQHQLTETCNQLHVLEALTEWYCSKPSEAVKTAMTSVVDMFIDHIFPAQETLTLKFNTGWQIANQEISYGHNFEAPFVLYQACDALADAPRAAAVKEHLLRLTNYTLAHGFHPSGSVLYGANEHGEPFSFLPWWPQTEASNALVLSYQLTGEQRYLQALINLWQTIKTHWVDTDHQEWFTELGLEMKPFGNQYKAGPWRCSYHTSRACFVASKGLYTPNNTL